MLCAPGGVGGAALLAVAVLAGCGGASAESGGCADAVAVEGETLFGIAVEDLPQRWPSPDGEVEVKVPHCTDDGTTGPAQSSRLTRLAGTPPRLGLAALDERGRVETVYLPDGYFLQLPAHPLHGARYRSATAPDETRRRCRSRPPVAGRVAHVSAWEGRLVLARGRRRTPWRVDARTHIDAPHVVAGIPRVEQGQRVSVAGLRCGKRRFVARVVRVRG
jgi:hypothetical protein